ncbi:MAG: cytochrome c biogenesis protein ResB [Deferrisomatales bacterium]
MLRALSSLKTTLLLCLALVGLSAWGSFHIQLHPAGYAAVEEGVLLEWLRRHGSTDPASAWWIVAMAAVAGLLAANTVVCVWRRLVEHRRAGRLPLRSLAAHGVHLGFLLVLAAHLVGSTAGFRSDGHPVFPGGSFSVPQLPGWAFEAGELTVEYAPQGYPRLLRADLAARAAGATLAAGAVEVNRPLHARGVAVYLKSAQPSLRGWQILLPGAPAAVAEVGRGLRLPGGELRVDDWTQLADRRLALQVAWRPDQGPPSRDWIVPRPGAPVPWLPQARWGEIVVDTLAIFDVRYDPGAGAALVGSIVLSVSLVPLVLRRRPRRRPPLLRCQTQPHGSP